MPTSWNPGTNGEINVLYSNYANYDGNANNNVEQKWPIAVQKALSSNAQNVDESHIAKNRFQELSNLRNPNINEPKRI